MKIIYNSLVLVLIFLTFSCSEQGKKERKEISNIKKVTVAFTGFGCEGRCPFQALSIDSSLTANYYGGKFAEKNGFYSGKVDQVEWSNIQTRFEKFTEIGLDTTEYQKTDHPSVEISINTDTKVYRFKENTGKIAETDLDVLYWFIRLTSNTNNLKKTDSLDFATSIQYEKL